MPHIVDILKERGLIESIANEEEFLKRVETPLKVYLGFDPTADSLHVGSLVGIIVLRWFQKCGHIPVVILGGATGRIGDPSGKSVERPLLDPATIIYNVTRIRRHFEAVLDFFHPSARPIVLNNDQWFASLNLIDFLRDVGKHFRVGTMLAKEMVRSRIDSDEGISFTEFSYQLLQAYDFYHLRTHHGVELELGGSDQWGNIVSGIELVRKISGQNVYGLTFPLLTRSDGRKFGKTEEGTIWLASDRCSPYQFYQYFIRIADADVIKMMRMLTFMEMEEIRDYEASLQRKDYIPNTAQRRLAQEVTFLIHGEEGLAKALKVTESAAPGSNATLDAEAFAEIAQDMPSVTLRLEEVVGQKFSDLAVKIGLLVSKAEAMRLIENGGAYLNNKRVEETNFRLTDADLIGGEYLLLGAGKKKKMLVKIAG
jgi:tyrosyl-tRNA synthetase